MIEAFKAWPYWWVVASSLASVAMIANETLNRQSPTFFAAIKLTFIPILVGQALLWYVFRSAPSLLTAWIVFSGLNMALRLGASSLILREQTDLRWAAVAGVLVIAAGLCIRRATS